MAVPATSLREWTDGYARIYGSDPLSTAFLRGAFPRVYSVLDEYVSFKTDGEYFVPLDDTLAYDVHAFLASSENAYPTADNLRILAAQFLYDKMAEYEGLIKRTGDTRRIKDEALWRRPSSYGVSSRSESVADRSPGALMFSRANPTRRQYLEWTGVGVPRNRQSW